MELRALKEGDRLEWVHYPPLRFMQESPADPSTKIGTVVIPATDEHPNELVAEHDGVRFFVRSRGDLLVSGAPPPAEPPAPAPAAEPPALPLGSWGRQTPIAESSEAISSAGEPSAGEIPAKVQTPVGVEYFGPAYHQAVDMLVEILGPALRAAGHTQENRTDPDEIVTLYCFVIETSPDLGEIEQRLTGLQKQIDEHEFAGHFGELSILNEDQVEKAAATTSDGTLPIL